MAVKEYVGARYVPKFAEPQEWNKSKEYENLEIVLHEGNSYTSKKKVPANVEITNTEYWACTGNYNVQVNNAVNDVKQVQKDVEAKVDGFDQTVEAGKQELQGELSGLNEQVQDGIGQLQQKTNDGIAKIEEEAQKFNPDNYVMYNKDSVNRALNTLDIADIKDTTKLDNAYVGLTEWSDDGAQTWKKNRFSGLMGYIKSKIIGGDRSWYDGSKMTLLTEDDTGNIGQTKYSDFQNYMVKQGFLDMNPRKIKDIVICDNLTFGSSKVTIQNVEDIFSTEFLWCGGKNTPNIEYIPFGMYPVSDYNYGTGEEQNAFSIAINNYIKNADNIDLLILGSTKLSIEREIGNPNCSDVLNASSWSGKLKNEIRSCISNLITKFPHAKYIVIPYFNYASTVENQTDWGSNSDVATIAHDFRTTTYYYTEIKRKYNTSKMTRDILDAISDGELSMISGHMDMMSTIPIKFDEEYTTKTLSYYTLAYNSLIFGEKQLKSKYANMHYVGWRKEIGEEPQTTVNSCYIEVNYDTSSVTLETRYAFNIHTGHFSYFNLSTELIETVDVLNETAKLEQYNLVGCVPITISEESHNFIPLQCLEINVNIKLTANESTSYMPATLYLLNNMMFLNPLGTIPELLVNGADIVVYPFTKTFDWKYCI